MKEKIVGTLVVESKVKEIVTGAVVVANVVEKAGSMEVVMEMKVETFTLVYPNVLR